MNKAELHLENLGSLITYKDDGKDRCLGYLMHFDQHGTYDAFFGQVDVTPEDAKAHNAALDTAMLEGLDKNCQIGQGNTFYHTLDAEGRDRVTTFNGIVVADADHVSITKHGTRFGRTMNERLRFVAPTITFSRQGKTYRGRLKQDAQCFNFKRIA